MPTMLVHQQLACWVGWKPLKPSTGADVGNPELWERSNLSPPVAPPTKSTLHVERETMPASHVCNSWREDGGRFEVPAMVEDLEHSMTPWELFRALSL